MALVTQSFAERYRELIARVPTYTELLLDVQRREVGERKALEEKCSVEFQDVLHVAAVMISDKKKLERGALARMNRFEIALYQKQTAVWFPAMPPRPVFFTGHEGRAFPHAAFAKLCQEEREIRQWHFCVEHRLREHIEEACSRAWFYLKLLKDTSASESLSRQRLQRDEDETFLSLRQRFFRAAPASYYRHLVIARYGKTCSAIEGNKELTFEDMEQQSRALLMEEEETARRSAFQYLQDIYDLQLFALNHHEVVRRYELEEEQRNLLYPLVAQCCRADFGLVFYHIPALAWHLSSSFPCLRALCNAHLQEAPRRTAALRARLSWVPAMANPGVTSELDEEGSPDEFDCDEEKETEQSEDGAGDDSESQSAPTVPLDSAPASPVIEKAESESELDNLEENKMGEEEEVCEASPTQEAVAPVCVCTSERPSSASEGDLAPEEEEDNLEVPYTSEAEDAHTPVLYAYEEMDAHSPVINAYDEADAAPKDATSASPSYRSTEVPLTRKPLSRALFTSFEVFIGDPFAVTPQPGARSRTVKNAK